MDNNMVIAGVVAAERGGGRYRGINGGGQRFDLGW